MKLSNMLIFSMGLFALMPPVAHTNECLIADKSDPFGCSFNEKLAEFSSTFTDETCKKLDATLKCLKENEKERSEKFCTRTNTNGRKFYKHVCSDLKSTLRHRECLAEFEDRNCKADWEQKQQEVMQELMTDNITEGFAVELKLEVCQAATYVCVRRTSDAACLTDAINFREIAAARYYGMVTDFICFELVRSNLANGGDVRLVNSVLAMVAALVMILLVMKAAS